MDRPILWPFGGKSSDLSFTDQKEQTYRDGQNIRSLDARTGRLQGAQRPGLTKQVASAAETGQPLKLVSAITHPQKTVDYSALANPTTEPPSAGEIEQIIRAAAPSQGEIYDLATDARGNVFVLDGNAGVAKYSADHKLVWSFPLPRADGSHVLRTIAVDRFGAVYAAASEGRSPGTARIWCVESDPEAQRLRDKDEPRLRWQIEGSTEDPAGEPYVRGFCAQIAWSNDYLYTVQNNEEEGKSWVVVYDRVFTSTPIVSATIPTAYLANGIAVKENGEFAVTCRETLERLDFAPEHPTSPQPSFPGIWTPEDDLPDFRSRVWAHFSSWKPMPDGSDPLFTITDKATGEKRVIQWRDRSGKERHLTRNQTAGIGAPYVVSRGLGGKRGVEFRGAEGLISLASTVIELEQADQQRAILPGYKGAAFALFMVVELTPKAERQAIIGVSNEDTGTGGGASAAFDRVVVANRPEGSTLTGPSPTAGYLSCYENPSGVAGDDPAAGVNAQFPAHAYFDTDNKPLSASYRADGNNKLEPVAGVLALVCDGHLDAPANTKRSVFWWNGTPIDRWNSREIQAAGAVQVGTWTSVAGIEALEGRIYEILVLDRMDRDDDTAGVLTMPEYPDATTAIAGGVGLVHIQARGSGHGTTTGSMAFTGGGGTGAAGTWRSIGGEIVETIVTAPGSGYTTQPTVSLTGSAGTGHTVLAYLREIPATPTIQATTELEKIIGSLAHQHGIAHLLDPGDGSRQSRKWTAADEAAVGAGPFGNTQEYGAFEFPFRLRADGSPNAPIALDDPDVNELYSPLPLTIKYGAEKDRPVRWIYGGTSTSNPRRGGHGFGIRALPSELDADGEPTGVQDFVTCGNETVNSSPVDQANVRRLRDDGDSVADSGVIISPATATTGTRCWALRIQEGGSDVDFASMFPRMAVDLAQVVYVPLSPDSAAQGSSLIAINSAGTELFRWHENAATPGSSQAAWAVAVPPLIPGHVRGTIFYEGDLAALAVVSEFAHVGLSTQDNTLRVTGTGGTSGLESLSKLRLVDSMDNGDPPRRTVFVVAANGNFKRLRPGDVSYAAPTGGTGLLVATASASYFGTPHFGKFYVADGRQVFCYDPHPAIDEIEVLTAKRGKMLERPGQVYSWNSRLVMIGAPDGKWAMSARNDPRNWDVEPAVITEAMAVSGVLLAQGPGDVPDVVNTFVPVATEIAIFGCDHQIHVLRGDPTVGAIELVTDEIGMARGPSWAQLPEGPIVFIDTRGDAYIMAPTGGAPRPISRDKIGPEMREIDWSTHYFHLVHSPEEDGVRFFQVPKGAGGTAVQSWFWSRRTGGFEGPDSFADLGMQPVSAYLFDGDDPDDRKLVIGCEDGFVRQVDRDADDDDGVSIDSYVTLGPLGERHSGRMTRFDRLRLTISRGAPRFELFATENPEVLGEVRHRGVAKVGFNVVPARIQAAFVYLRLRDLSHDSWAFEEALIDVEPGGMRRMLR